MNLNPIADDGTICLIQGDDYKAADGRGVSFDLTGMTLVGASVKLLLSPINCESGKAVSVPGTIAGSTVSIDIPSAVTRLLTQGNPSYLYWLIVTLADGDIVTPVTGGASVRGL